MLSIQGSEEEFVKYSEIAKFLLQHGAKITTIPVAASAGSVEDIKRLIEEGHDIEDYLANTEMEALHIASFLGNFEIIRFIVQKVEFINSTDSYGNTPIDYAKDERIKSLLEKNGGESSSEMWNSIYHDFNAANEIKFGTLQGKKLLQAARSGNINSLKNILSLSLQLF